MKLIFIPVTVLFSSGVLAQSDKKPSLPELKIEKNKKVWMLTYFRQRYPTRIEIDAQGKVVPKNWLKLIP